MDDEHFGEMWRDLSRSMERSFDRQHKRIDQLKTEPCMDIAEVGNHVLIDPSAVGKGLPENPLEAEVLRVAGTAYEVRYLTYTKYDSDELVVEWVQSWVVIAVIKNLTTDTTL